MFGFWKSVWVASALLISCVCLADEQLRQRIEGWNSGYPAQLNERRISNHEAIATFYTEHRYQLLWLQNGELTASAKQLLTAIESIAGDGLNPQDYHSVYLHAGFTKSPKLTWVEYDILLSDAFMSLAQHLLNGKVHPETLTHEWKAQRVPVDTPALLSRVAKGESAGMVLDTQRTKQARYQRSKIVLQNLREHPQQTWDALALTPVIKPDMRDPRLPAIAQRLLVWGDLTSQTGVDTYHEGLVEAVERFQSRHGLKADGVIGPETLKALNITIAQRVQDITVNLERWRWLQEDFGQRFVVVNIAAFDLRVYEANRKIFQRSVIVGRNYRKTPVFSDRIRHLVFNPTWTVPHKLAVQDKLPEIRKDPTYLERLGFSLFHIGTSEIVDPAAIDWQGLPKNRFPFRMVQGPGPQNALGQVKFMFPNAFDVYLHDTPARELFSKPERAFSSGCIRVSDPLALAQVLLNNKKGWDSDKITRVIDSGKTTTVFLEEPVPVHIEYWTAWVDSDSQLHFRKDIYGRDEPLWQALQAKL